MTLLPKKRNTERFSLYLRPQKLPKFTYINYLQTPLRFKYLTSCVMTPLHSEVFLCVWFSIVMWIPQGILTQTKSDMSKDMPKPANHLVASFSLRAPTFDRWLLQDIFFGAVMSRRLEDFCCFRKVPLRHKIRNFYHKLPLLYNNQIIEQSKYYIEAKKTQIYHFSIYLW